MADADDHNWRSRLVRDGITPCLDEVGTLLSTSVSCGFETLASRLGYSGQDIDGFKLHRNPGRSFLEHWMTGADTTVRLLMAHLQDMGRHDVVKTLVEHFRDPKCMLVIVIDKYTRCPRVSKNSTIKEILDELCTTDDELRFHTHDKYIQYVGEAFHPGSVKECQAKECQGHELKFKTLARKKSTTFSAPIVLRPQVQKKPSALSENIEITKRRAVRVPSEHRPLLPDVRISRPEPHEEPADHSSGDLVVDFHQDDPGPDTDPDNAAASSQDLQNTSTRGEAEKDSMPSIDELSLKSGLSGVSSPQPDQCVRHLNCYREEAVNDTVIAHIFALYMKRDGHYIVRPSRSFPGSVCLSVTYRGNVISFRIFEENHLNEPSQTRYFISYDSIGPKFGSIQGLIEHYKNTPMPIDPDDNNSKPGPYLYRAVPDGR